jgi:hypothetical protein
LYNFSPLSQTTTASHLSTINYTPSKDSIANSIRIRGKMIAGKEIQSILPGIGIIVMDDVD